MQTIERFSSKSPLEIKWISENPKPKKPKESNCKKSFVKTFYEYCLYTKVNGFYFYQKGVTKGLERILWIIIPILVFLFGIFMIILLWQRYLDFPIRITIGAALSTVQVPFPAVTICHPQNVVDYKIENFLSKLKLPKNVSTKQISDALPTIGLLTEYQWSQPNPDNIEIVKNLLKINNMSIYTANIELGKTCEDFILNCRWSGIEFPCFQEHPFFTFKQSTTHLGVCCSFNYHPENKDETTYAANTFGVSHGLTIVGTGYPQDGNGISGALFSNGFVALIHHPNDFATEEAEIALLELNTATYIDVLATDRRASDQVLELPLKQRKCVIQSDKPNMRTSYRQSACTLECMRDEIHRICGCHPYHLPRPLVYTIDQLRDCEVSDVMCFVDNFYLFRQVNCQCLPACSDVTYRVTNSVTGFDAFNYSTDPIYTNLTTDEFVMDIFLSSQYVSSSRKIVVMSWITLLSNLGGIFNLCAGISMLSIIEVLYFLIVRFRVNLMAPKEDIQLDYYEKNKLQIFTGKAQVERF